jgi:hypothetical protein
MRLLVPAFGLLGLLVGCQSAPKASPGMASLRVDVVAEPKAGSRLEARAPTMYDQPGRTATPEPAAYHTVDYDNLADVIVYLEPAGGGVAPPRTIDVKPGAAAGAVVPASVGQRLTFRNAGARPTGLYSVSDGNEFDAASVPPGGTADYTVRSAGLIELLTDPAKDPALLVYAAPSRFVAATRSGKSVDFVDVPPGAYTVVAWHPRLPGGQTAVNLGADRSARATVKVGVNALPKVGAR